MAISKSDRRLESVEFEFVEDGEGNPVVTGVTARANYALLEDGRELTRVRQRQDLRASLTSAERSAARSLGEALRRAVQGM